MAETRGSAGMPDFEAMDCALGLPDGRSLAIHQNMATRQLVDEEGNLLAWDKRQPKREREDDSSSRVAAHRARKAAKDGVTDGVTPSNAVSRQETPREEKRREEKNLGGGSASSASDDDLPAVAPLLEPIDRNFDAGTAAPLPMREEAPLSSDPAVQLSVKLRRLGVTALFTHPDVQAWAARSVSADVIEQAVLVARERKGTAPIPVGYLRPIVEQLMNPPTAQARASPDGTPERLGKAGQATAQAAEQWLAEQEHG